MALDLLPIPEVELVDSDKGTVFKTKMNVLSVAMKTAVQAFNTQIAAGNLAENSALVAEEHKNAASVLNAETAESAAIAQQQKVQAQAAATTAGLHAATADRHRATAQAAESAAWSVANYKGAWASLTGALSMPAVVWHNSAYWQLQSNTTSVQADTPGVSARWRQLVDVSAAVADGHRRSVEAASGGKNTVLYDAQGNPNVMVVIPRFSYEDLNLPLLELGTGVPTAFMAGGTARSEIFIAKYLASTPSGTAGCSVVAGQQPRTSVNFDTARALCSTKGPGWHLMTIHEWAAIALWSLANGTVPRGNTFHGRSHERAWEAARRADNGIPGDIAGTPRTDTGKGPRTWAHDHTDFGIHDLVGNCWEWIDQFKLIDGQIITTTDNTQSLTEDNWVATGAFYDSTSPTGGAPRLAHNVSNYLGVPGDNQNAGFSSSVDFFSIPKDPGYTPNLLLRRILAETSTSTTVGGRVYTRNFGERFPLRGGFWSGGANAGLGALYLTDSRSNSRSLNGFRPAFFV